MSPTSARCRRGACLLATLLVASCGGSHRFELSLRSREANGALTTTCVAVIGEAAPDNLEECALVFKERRWVTSDGGRAITPAHTEYTFVLWTYDSVACGGKDFGPMYRRESAPDRPADDDSFELKLDDGNTLVLDQQTGHWGYFDEIKCFETAGRWRGTAGRLKDHTGTFTIVYDSIQTLIRLVED